MKHLKKTLLCLTLLGPLVSMAVAGCGSGGAPEPGGDAPPAVESPGSGAGVTLSLALRQEDAASAVVEVGYARSPGREGPRVMEVHLGLPSGVTLAASEPLDAARAAGKQVVVQTEPEGRLRVVVFSPTSLERVDSGPLVRLALQRAPGAAGAVSFLPELPVFAPLETNEGVVFGEPVTVGGGS